MIRDGEPTPEVVAPPTFRVETDELGNMTGIYGTLPSPVPKTNGWEAEYHRTRPWENRSEPES